MWAVILTAGSGIELDRKLIADQTDDGIKDAIQEVVDRATFNLGDILKVVEITERRKK